MKTAAIDLQDLYQQQLIDLIAAEKKHIKCIGKLSKAIRTDELKTAIASDTTDIVQHLERLQLCKTMVKSKSGIRSAVKHPITKVVEDYPKTLKSSLLLDICILRYMQDAFMLKIVSYQQLQLMAAALGQNQAAQLLEQSANDNQNSYGYMMQISANIIYPATISNETTHI